MTAGGVIYLLETFASGSEAGRRLLEVPIDRKTKAGIEERFTLKMVHVRNSSEEHGLLEVARVYWFKPLPMSASWSVQQPMSGGCAKSPMYTTWIMEG